MRDKKRRLHFSLSEAQTDVTLLRGSRPGDDFSESPSWKIRGKREALLRASDYLSRTCSKSTGEVVSPDAFY